MKRIAFAALGIVWGLLVAWACLYAFSILPRPEVSPSHVTGCGDMEHCAPHWKFVTGLLVTTLWPSIIFATLNIFAYRRWSPREWRIKFAATTLFIVLVHLFFYVSPYLWLLDRWLVK